MTVFLSFVFALIKQHQKSDSYKDIFFVKDKKLRVQVIKMNNYWRLPTLKQNEDVVDTDPVIVSVSCDQHVSSRHSPVRIHVDLHGMEGVR